MAIVKASKVNLTAGRIAGLECPSDKSRTYLWSDEVKGLGVIATSMGAKSYIYQAKVKGKSMRLTIGNVSVWSIAAAKTEARRLQILIDNGNDPRQVKADKIAAIDAAIQAQKAEAAALTAQQARESVTVADAWQAYIADRSAAMKDGKPVWGEKHKAHHAYFVQAGGTLRTRGRRPNEPAITRAGVLVPLMTMRLAALDEQVIASWLEKETAQAPTTAAQAFRALRAFLTWCAKQDAYRAATHTDACQSDSVKTKVPDPSNQEKRLFTPCADSSVV